jgi:hypothetical protein
MQNASTAPPPSKCRVYVKVEWTTRRGRRRRNREMLSIRRGQRRRRHVCHMRRRIHVCVI